MKSLLTLIVAHALAGAGLSAGDGGGKNHWSYQPLSVIAPPIPKDRIRIATPIDQFILSRLEQPGLDLAPKADRPTLIRRLHLDLIGLPPSPAQINAFVTDERADAYGRLVDRLLASPHLGERWGRHWLDAAGYVDVLGGDNDAATVKLADGKWLYRDYVIRSLNRDQPFDRFLVQQLAGDELVDWRSAKKFTPEITEHLIATTFLRSAADETYADELNTPDIRHRVLQHATEIVAGNLLAMTLQCAKCHDHKYDPISQRDYYSFAAIFSPAFNPANWRQPDQRQLADIPLPDQAKIDAFNKPIDKRIGKIEKRQKQAAEDKIKKVAERLAKKIAALRKERKTYGHYQTVYDVAAANDFHILKRGDHLTPGAKVSPGLPVTVDPDRSAYNPVTGEVREKSSGRRLALARALTNPDTRIAALVARVQVNRIWQHLFGTGLVDSSDNFGPSGQQPSHPDLLEWLAHRFVRDGYRVKPLLRLLVTSEVYRQASAVPKSTAPRTADPGNRLLWRMPLKRLESEIVRDSLLSVAGQLDPTMGGHPVPTRYHKDGRLEFDPKRMTGTTNASRRSIYIRARRNYHLTLLNLFDQPALNTLCTERLPSASVTQALAMLNDATVLEQSRQLARRVGIETKSPDIDIWIRHTFRLALGRRPAPAESRSARGLVDRHIGRYLDTEIPWTEAAEKALEHLAQMLFNTNEFLYTP
jgi:hypothetical protein